MPVRDRTTGASTIHAPAKAMRKNHVNGRRARTPGRVFSGRAPIPEVTIVLSPRGGWRPSTWHRGQRSRSVAGESLGATAFHPIVSQRDLAQVRSRTGPRSIPGRAITAQNSVVRRVAGGRRG
ncbi:hypothetical protein GCM10023175_64140 [Pseudonocardia xishanensis]|uniref:Uncharacterized protein n=1 Tax=Pseudonocardia xishanensis TaxID=630995 RepID=A0ABP8S1P0_9PSEU